MLVSIGEKHARRTAFFQDYLWISPKFSISELELRNLLASEEVVSAPIVKYANNSGSISYIREVNVGVNIGFDKFNGNKLTSVLTVFTDRFGNLLTSFPGIQK